MHHPHLHFFSTWFCIFASLHLCNFFPVYLPWLVTKLGLDKKRWKLVFVNFRVFVCLFKRPGSIPNDSISIWNASLSLKQANKHSKINKQTISLIVYPTLKKTAKMQKWKDAKMQNQIEKKCKCGWCLNLLIL